MNFGAKQFIIEYNRGKLKKKKSKEINSEI